MFRVFPVKCSESDSALFPHSFPGNEVFDNKEIMKDESESCPTLRTHTGAPPLHFLVSPQRDSLSLRSVLPHIGAALQRARRKSACRAAAREVPLHFLTNHFRFRLLKFCSALLRNNQNDHVGSAVFLGSSCFSSAHKVSLNLLPIDLRSILLARCALANCSCATSSLSCAPFSLFLLAGRTGDR